MVHRGTCSYCQTEDVLLWSTPELEPYCIDCNTLTASNCNRAIKELKAAGARRRKPPSIDELKAKADEAMAGLMGGQTYSLTEESP
jgi:hypothetical protein